VGKDEYRIDMAIRFAALKSLDDDMDSNTDGETTSTLGGTSKVQENRTQVITY
jgi:hypothetical protein